MKDQKACKKYIIKHEAARIQVYDDKTGKPPVTPGEFKGKPTIGIGFNLKKSGAKEAIEALGLNYDDVLYGRAFLKKEHVDALFEEDFSLAVEDARSYYSGFDHLTPMRQIVLVDMAFNMGLSKLKEFEKVHKALSANPPQYDVASSEILDSDYAGQVGVRATRNAEAMVNDMMPYDNIVVNASEKETVKEVLSEGNNTGSGSPILPDESISQTPEEIRRLAVSAIEGNDATVNRREYNKMSIDKEKSARYNAMIKTVDYVDKLRNYGFGLSEELKQRRAAYSRALMNHPGDNQHPEVLAAEFDLEMSLQEYKEFQEDIKAAEMYGTFAIQMASSLAKLTGHDETANKINFYGTHLLTIGVSAARLYGGDPMGAVGLVGSVMAIAGGMPSPSREQQMLEAIYEMLRGIKEDIRRLQDRIDILAENIEFISEQIRGLKENLEVITEIGIAILKELSDIREHLQDVDYLRALIDSEDRKIYSGFSEMRTAIINGDNIDAQDAEEMHRKWNLYTQVLAKSKSVLAATQESTPERVSYLISQRSVFENSSGNLANGCLHTLDALLRMAENFVSGLQFSRKEIEVSGKEVHLIVNLPMWQDGAETRILFVRNLCEQGTLSAYIDEVGEEAVLRAFDQDIKGAIHTQQQLQQLSESDFLDKLIEVVSLQYNIIVSKYVQHNYHRDRYGLRKYIKEGVQFRNKLVGLEKHPHSLSEDLLWSRHVARSEHKKIKVFVKGENQTSNYRSEFQLETRAILHETGSSIKVIEAIDDTQQNINYSQYDGLFYPTGLNFDIKFGCHHTYSGYGPTRKTHHNGGKGDIMVHMVSASFSDWDKGLLDKFDHAHEVNYYRRADAKKEILGQVKYLEDDFERLGALCTVLRAVISLMMVDGTVIPKINEAINQFHISQQSMINYIANHGLTIGMDWRNPRFDFSKFQEHANRVTHNLNDVFLSIKSDVHNYLMTPFAKRVGRVIKQLRMNATFIKLSQLEGSNPEELNELLKDFERDYPIDSIEDIESLRDAVSLSTGTRWGFWFGRVGNPELEFTGLLTRNSDQQCTDQCPRAYHVSPISNQKSRVPSARTVNPIEARREEIIAMCQNADRYDLVQGGDPAITLLKHKENGQTEVQLKIDSETVSFYFNGRYHVLGDIELLDALEDPAGKGEARVNPANAH